MEPSDLEEEFKPESEGGVDEAITQAVARISKADQVIAQISAEYMQIKVAGPDDEAGFQTADTALKRVKRLRIETEKVRKELKKDVNRYSKAVDGESNRIKALIAPIEEHLKTQTDIVRLEKVRLKVEAENARREQVADWARQLSEMGATVELGRLEKMSEEEFSLHRLSESKKAHERRVEQERIESERRAEREVLEARNAELEKQRQAEREAMEAERKEIEAERQRMQAERDVIESEKAEKRRIEAEAEAERKRIEAEEAEAKRLEKLKPVIEQIDKFALQVESLSVPEPLFSYNYKISNILLLAATEIRGLVR